MPKLPVVAGSDVVRALDRLGFLVTRQRWSHIMMRRRSCSFVVHNHRQLKAGTLVGLLKHAEVSPQEFLEALNV